MKNHLKTFGIYVIAVVITIVLSNLLLFASESRTDSITVVATILPQRVIVVDDNLTVTKVYSNTSEDVRPFVYQGSIDGKEIPYSDSIVEQYQRLKFTINFSQPGLVYQRDDRPIPAFFARLSAFLKRWL